MEMLDPKQYLHSRGRTFFRWTPVLVDEDSSISYIGYVNRDDVLLVQSTVAGDVTTILYACYRGYADQIDTIWSNRGIQTYVRFDLLRASIPILFMAFLQPFDNAEATLNVTGGSSEDPTTKTDITVSGGLLQGVAAAAQNTTEGSILSTMITPSGPIMVLSLQMQHTIFTTYAPADIVVYDSDGTKIFTFRFQRVAGNNRQATILDATDAVVATMHDGTGASALQVWTFTINLTTKTLDVTASILTLTNNTDIDISDSMTSINVGKVLVNAYPTLGVETTVNIKFDNIAITKG